MPTVHGSPGWAVVEPAIADDTAATDAVRARLAAGEAERQR
ncbi:MULTISPECIES: hypothetical protein [unclassified Streptomyces]|nr:MULTISPECIES: hypothetical protein [unclassified Streptomyces]